MKLKIAWDWLEFLMAIASVAVVIGFIMVVIGGENHDEVADFSKPEIWVDPETRVQYLIIDDENGAALTVRLNQNGTPFTGGDNR